MEKKVRVQERAQGGRGARMMVRQCPHCGGDVRTVRDIYGAYQQCFQCSREIPLEQLEQLEQLAAPAEGPKHQAAAADAWEPMAA